MKIWGFLQDITSLFKIPQFSVKFLHIVSSKMAGNVHFCRCICPRWRSGRDHALSGVIDARDASNWAHEPVSRTDAVSQVDQRLL